MAKSKVKSESDSYCVVEVHPSACPDCHCTEREGYFAINTQVYAGISPSGFEFNRITRKRTRCKRCGRPRVDKFYENIDPEAQ